MSLDFKNLEKIFDIEIENQDLFKKALTHGSFTKSNNLKSLESYERLEFLGDAVLKLCVSEILYKKFPEQNEGDLTKIRSIIVSDNTLAEIARELKINELILLSKQEEKCGGRSKTSILACALEALLGAFYLEGKITELSLFLEKTMEKHIESVHLNFEKFNAKAVLQEYTQSQTKMTPDYKIIEETGPQHNKTFLVEVAYMGKVLAHGTGKTKREAEQNGAFEACKSLGVIE